MLSNEASSQKANPTFRWSAFIQLILSALAAFLLFAAAGVIILVNAIQYFTPGNVPADLTQSFMIAASLVFMGILVLPSAWHAWKSIAYPQAEAPVKPERRSTGLILTVSVVVLVPGALLLGNWVSQTSPLAWLFLPPLNLIATGLPTLWLVYLGTHGLPLGSPRQHWGVFATGLVLSPLLILVLELVLLAGVGVLVILWVAVDPSLASQMNILLLRLQNSYTDPEAVLRILFPLLSNPGILFILFAFISLLVPMIEEVLKPLGLWFLAGQKLTPSHGFVYGVLSGAGFGLFENLGNTSGGGEAWAILVSTRISTVLLHCFTAGLVGWALVSAWRQKRYLRLGTSYMLAVLIHGLWNGMAVMSAAASLPGLIDISIPASWQRLGSLSGIGIVALGILVLVLYIGFNASLRRNLVPGGHGSLPTDDIPGSQGLTPGEPRLDAGNRPQTPKSEPRDQTSPGVNDT